MIEISNVTKVYNKTYKAVDNISMDIRDGEIFGLLGPNGAGKTTTIKMLTGIIDITEGEIKLNGKSIKDNPLEAKKLFGFVPDSPDMFLRLKGIFRILRKIPEMLRSNLQHLNSSDIRNNQLHPAASQM